MSEDQALKNLKDVYHQEGKSNRGSMLTRALLSIAVPVTAGLAMACYGVPMEDEFDCSDNVDNDDNGLVDCADSMCSSSELCSGGCFDGTDNDGNESVDCDDWSCSETEACLTVTGCSDGDDNDDNGLTDCDDPACTGSPDCP